MTARPELPALAGGLPAGDPDAPSADGQRAESENGDRDRVLSAGGAAASRIGSSGGAAGGPPSRAREAGGGAAAPEKARLPFLDLLRAVASQVIVWHHLVLYGPLPERAHPLAPALFDALADYGRMAVQVFFVLGGFFAAKAMSEEPPDRPVAVAAAVARRYRRIGLPYLALLVLAVAANALARHWMSDPAISAPPTPAQLLAHALFLQDILGYESLSAGLWYLAVDFQLGLLVIGGFALATRLQAWLAPRVSLDRCALTQLLLAPLAVASLFGFNRDPSLDVWAVYFFGSYFLGMVLQGSVAGKVPQRLLWAYLALVSLAVLQEWRPRLLVAAATALLVLAAMRDRRVLQAPRSRWVASLGRISYSLFLVHFPVCLVVNAVFARAGAQGPSVALAGLIAAYAAALGAASAFHRGVEEPARGLGTRRG